MHIIQTSVVRPTVHTMPPRRKSGTRVFASPRSSFTIKAASDRTSQDARGQCPSSERFRRDLAAQIGSVKLGEKRLGELIAEFGGETVTAAKERILDAAERQARAVIETWKDGIYHGEALLDDDGRGNVDIAIRATVTVKGSEVEVDLTASDPEVESFINSSFANTQSAVVMSYAFLLDPGIAQNAGTIRPLSVKIKEGTIVWARPGAPVTARRIAARRLSKRLSRQLRPPAPNARWQDGENASELRSRARIRGMDGRSFGICFTRPGAGASSGGDGWR